MDFGPSAALFLPDFTLSGLVARLISLIQNNVDTNGGGLARWDDPRLVKTVCLMEIPEFRAQWRAARPTNHSWRCSLGSALESELKGPLRGGEHPAEGRALLLKADSGWTILASFRHRQRLSCGSRSVSHQSFIKPNYKAGGRRWSLFYSSTPLSCGSRADITGYLPRRPRGASICVFAHPLAPPPPPQVLPQTVVTFCLVSSGVFVRNCRSSFL